MDLGSGIRDPATSNGPVVIMPSPPGDSSGLVGFVAEPNMLDFLCRVVGVCDPEGAAAADGDMLVLRCRVGVGSALGGADGDGELGNSMDVVPIMGLSSSGELGFGELGCDSEMLEREESRWSLTSVRVRRLLAL